MSVRGMKQARARCQAQCWARKSECQWLNLAKAALLGENFLAKWRGESTREERIRVMGKPRATQVFAK